MRPPDEDPPDSGERPPDDDDLDADDAFDEDDDLPEPAVTVEIAGLSLYTFHGVTAAEREVGQRLIVDVAMDVVDCDALLTDRIEDTVDYGQVCEQVALAVQERSYRTLEALSWAVAGRLLGRFAADSVRVKAGKKLTVRSTVKRYGAESVEVKAAKPEPPMALTVDEVSVEVVRHR